ncbi:Uma2 family endonuclease [Hymenobacter siberiensis]|uniref:Uma2 family endonuclease n=1 Tax=Hymenobacter siberiensis TaxID=2848396 RepID=UPI001C1E04F3|nr:Uma2 family endonuclease [Hymenobacter siberiensis]MBU6119722.1 Uma2 family endonuclease [Hymenobacter siberiensis]
MAQPAFQTEPTSYVSPEEYLRLEREAEFKHEYFQGETRAMAGAGYAHNLICANLTGELYSRLRSQGCSVVSSDQRLQIMSGSAFVYPDLTVVCGKPEFNEEKKPDTLLNPTLLVEVLSPTTSQYDRSEKFMLYRQVPSLRQYLTLDAQAIHAELHTLDDLGRWVLTETRDLSATLDLSSIGCQVPLAEVYAGV